MPITFDTNYKTEFPINHYLNNFRTGHGIWKVVDVTTGGFKELRLDTSTLRRAADHLRVGKIVKPWDGSAWEQTWENKDFSKTGLLYFGPNNEIPLQIYPKLNESPYNFNIFAEPLNWD